MLMDKFSQTSLLFKEFLIFYFRYCRVRKEKFYESQQPYRLDNQKLKIFNTIPKNNTEAIQKENVLYKMEINRGTEENLNETYIDPEPSNVSFLFGFLKYLF